MPFNLALLETFNGFSHMETEGNPHHSLHFPSHMHCSGDLMHVGRAAHPSAFREVPYMVQSHRSKHAKVRLPSSRERAAMHFDALRKAAGPRNVKPSDELKQDSSSDSHNKSNVTTKEDASPSEAQSKAAAKDDFDDDKDDDDKDADEDDADDEGEDGAEGDEDGELPSLDRSIQGYADQEEDNSAGVDEAKEEDEVGSDLQHVGTDENGSSALPPMIPDTKSGGEESDFIRNDFERKHKENIQERDAMMGRLHPPTKSKISAEQALELAETEKLVKIAGMMSSLEKSTSMTSEVQALMEQWRKPYVRQWVAKNHDTRAGMFAQFLANLTRFSANLGSVARRGRSATPQDQVPAKQTNANADTERMGIQEAAFSYWQLLPWLDPKRDAQARREVMLAFL
eukprot:gnl/MRDRNA2_/MRDRNA2_30176_c0_seq1.p1 gnl/MRDRNA2_/MRDRNA2_30176_c0~~gnl/MRDRNA2_/MRDRNA2_30176_c0_seq1.p1  ORF type:complete len:399 (+),score=89.73 gnl/MRDRNA2_/MRDRNA2_30176_c0_seq1:50-1246(+)